MPARLIHVGEDHWHRLQVLRGSGLSVDECRGLEDLTVRLKTGVDLRAVMLAASPVFDPAPAVELVRSVKKCPIILFSTSLIVPEPQRYDLIVDPLTDPVEWLADVWTIIARTQQLRADSRAIQQTSQQLRQESLEVWRRSREQRAEARKLAADAKNPPWPDGK